MFDASDRLRDQGDGLPRPISWVEAYDPAYWRYRAERARKKARDVHEGEAAALGREAADYERLAAYAAAVAIAAEAA